MRISDWSSDVCSSDLAATGCKLSNPGASARMERGGGLPRVGRVPYILQQALAYLTDTSEMELVGARRPVAFFAYPGQPSLRTQLGRASGGERVCRCVLILVAAVKFKKLQTQKNEM